MARSRFRRACRGPAVKVVMEGWEGMAVVGLADLVGLAATVGLAEMADSAVMEGWEVDSPPVLERSANRTRNPSHHQEEGVGRVALVKGCSHTPRARVRAPIR
jgi:hypothetical protein